MRLLNLRIPPCNARRKGIFARCEVVDSATLRCMWRRARRPHTYTSIHLQRTHSRVLSSVMRLAFATCMHAESRPKV